jgi:RNA polymerase sigma factor (sigma-70 family)
MNGQVIAQVLSNASPGDTAGRLAALFDAHHHRLYRLARRLVPTADDALDLVQDTFLRAARSPNAVPVGTTDEEAWLVRVLVNIRRDQWRRAAVRERFNRNTTTGSGELSSSARDPEAVLIARATVWQALDLLSPRRRAVVVMYEIEGLEISSIAALLGISSITVRWHLSRGRRELARAIKPAVIDRSNKGGTQ